jgi:O-acetyl-ADP-ribose deacetylase (regulator of RNase III)
MIIYENGDLIKSDCDIIAHGCNCFHRMKSGIAKQIVEKYPMAAMADEMNTEFGDPSKLGNITFCEYYEESIKSFRYIINCYTQYRYGREEGVVYADYDAIRECMYKLKSLAKEHNCKLGIPKIGAGLAKGDWNIISKIIEDIFSDYDIYVYSLNTEKEINKT